MATAPYGVRLLVGAATVAVEETMKLPRTILMYPMTLASQAAHVVMRFQQGLAELVIKGDNTLETLFPPKDEAGVGNIRRGLARRARRDFDSIARLVGCQRSQERRSPVRRAVRVVLGIRYAGNDDSIQECGSLDQSQNRQAPQVGGQADSSDACGGSRTRLSGADAGPAAGQAAHARCPRARGPAGLRAGHQGPCPVQTLLANRITRATAK